MSYADPVLTAVSTLPPEERARLADYLQASLGAETEREVDPAEVKECIEALRRGDIHFLETHASARLPRH